jgi:hypothetical protein
VPYYIVINSLMELVIVPFAIFSNWRSDPKRKSYVIIGVLLYFATRVWTYAVFAETRLAISDRTLSDADVEWFKQTLATDYRIYLELVTQGFFILAAFVTGSRMREKNHQAANDRLTGEPRAALDGCGEPRRDGGSLP